MCVDPMFPAYLQIVACLVCWILSLTTRPIHQIILPAKWKGSRRFRVRHRLKWLEVATLWQQRCVQIQKAGHLSVTGWRIGLSLPRHPVKLAKKCLACNVLSLSTLLCLILGTYENIVTPVIYFMLANEFHFPLPLCRAVTALCVTLQTPQCCGWQIWLCLVACSWFRPSFPVSPTASEPPSGKVPAYLLVHPFESFDRKILVPKSTISRLKSAGLIEELATETASLNHFGWIESIAVSKRCEALLAALPEGKQKQLFSQQLSSQGFASDVSPAAAADSTPQDSSPDCLRIDQEFLENAASGSQLPEPDRKKLAQYAQLLGIAQKKAGKKKNNVQLASECLAAAATSRPFPVSPTASEPPAGNVPAYLLVHPFESFDRKILVPKSTISRLKSAGLIEELATETASLNHFGWIESIAVSKRCEALLAALPEGKQKQLFSQQLSSQGFASDVSPAAAADSTSQESSPDCLRIDQEFLKNAASGSQLPGPDRKKLAQYAQLLGIAQKKAGKKKNNVQLASECLAAAATSSVEEQQQKTEQQASQRGKRKFEEEPGTEPAPTDIISQQQTIEFLKSVVALQTLTSEQRKALAHHAKTLQVPQKKKSVRKAILNLRQIAWRQ